MTLRRGGSPIESHALIPHSSDTHTELEPPVVATIIYDSVHITHTAHLEAAPPPPSKVPMLRKSADILRMTLPSPDEIGTVRGGDSIDSTIRRIRPAVPSF